MSHAKVPTPVVLVVDDEALIRWSVTEALTESGYHVRPAATGAEALVELAAVAGDALVILLDLRLPDVADLSLLREIRARRPDAPVVMMTAHGTPDDAAQARLLGASRFLSKPFDVTEVVRAITDVWTHRLG